MDHDSRDIVVWLNSFIDLSHSTVVALTVLLSLVCYRNSAPELHKRALSITCNLGCGWATPPNYSANAVTSGSPTQAENQRGGTAHLKPQVHLTCFQQPPPIPISPPPQPKTKKQNKNKMPTPRIHLTIDTPLLASSSRDTLVLARKINNVFNTALAVASLNPPSPSSTSHSSPQIQTSQLYPQNIFAWDNTFRVAVSSVPAPGTGGALAASLTNAVDIAHGETVQFSKNVLLPPTAATSGEVVDGVGAGLRDLSLVASSSSSGGKGGVITHVFSVADVPPTCRVEVMQVVGGGGKGREGSACRVWQGEEGGLGRLIEVRVSDTVSFSSSSSSSSFPW